MPQSNKAITLAPAGPARAIVGLTVKGMNWSLDLNDCRHALITLLHVAHPPIGGMTFTEVDFYSHPSEGWQITRFHSATYARRGARGLSRIVEQNEFTEAAAELPFVERLGVLEPHDHGPRLHRWLDDLEDAMYAHGVQGVTGRGAHRVLGRVAFFVNVAKAVNDEP